MADPIFPEEALAVLRATRYDPKATRSYELLSGSFIWSDEGYLDFVIVCRDRGCRRYWDPVAYRTSLILGSPREEFRPGWEELLRLCPGWPGFRPERRSDALRRELDLAMKEDF